MAHFLRRLFSIGIENTDFKTRGFRLGRPGTRARLEHIGRTFLTGYHAALEDVEEHQLAVRLEQVDLEDRGFAFEGAAMALTFRDKLLPASRKLAALMQGSGKRHLYMLHVGAGWALARMPWLRLERAIRSFDPLLRWLVVDGCGFHEGYFHWPHVKVPKGLSTYGLHAFDQGLGRALWFIQCGDVKAIAQTIQGFPEDRCRDLWGGLGLAAAYAGGVSCTDLIQLRSLSAWPVALARGAAFAAAARELAGNPTEQTERACEIFCGISAREASRASDEALAHLRAVDPHPGYQDWIFALEQRLAALVPDSTRTRS